MDKEIQDLINLYHNRIKDLENKNKEKQDKLDKIEKYICNHHLVGMRYGKTLYADSLNNILQIIKGEDK